MDKLDVTAIPPNSQQVVDANICHFETSVYKSLQLRIGGAGRERCLPDYLIVRDGYPCFTLEFVASGRGELELNGQKTQLLPGHLFLYGPGIRFSMRADPEAPMLKYFIEFFGGSPQKLFHSGIIAPGETRRTTEIDHLAELFEQLIATGKRRPPQQLAICVAYLNLILAKTTEAILGDSSSSVHLLENLERCRSLIEKHYHEIPNLKALGERAHLDQSYMCRLFKQFGLQSPHQYLDNCRMNRAVEILLTTDWAVKAVAAAVGYADPLHFSRNFRRKFGCPPRDFRSSSMNRRSPKLKFRSGED